MFTLTSFLVEKMIIPLTGCCDSGMYCRPCEFAAGVNGPLPTNASWEGPNNCTWACNDHYEILPGGDAFTCEFCAKPDCVIGEYWTDCNVCADCKASPPNTFFSSAGATRYDATSCSYICVENFFQHENNGTCVACTAPNTLNCSNQPHGQKFEQVCSVHSDTMCVDCQVCPLGFNASTPCSASENAVCTACDTSLMPLNTEGGGAVFKLGASDADYCQWECRKELLYNPVENTCISCQNDACSVGYYGVLCSIENNFIGCAQCVTPDNSTVLSAGIMSLPSSCLWECIEGYIYNSAQGKCNPMPVVVPVTLDVENVVSTCIGSVCGFGKFIPLEDNIISGVDSRPCNTRCIFCPDRPFIIVSGVRNMLAVYIRKGSCEWVCTTPLIRQGNKCIEIS